MRACELAKLVLEWKIEKYHATEEPVLYGEINLPPGTYGDVAPSFGATHRPVPEKPGRGGTPIMLPRTPVSRALLTFAVFAFVLLAAAQPASALRVVTYNILNWPSLDWPGRYQYFQTVMDSLDADVIIVQEIESQTGVNNFREYCLNASVPGEYSSDLFVNGPDTDNAIFYRNSVVDTVTHVTIPTDVRWTMEYTVTLNGYDSSEAQFKILSTHLKAGSSSSDIATREDQCEEIRAHMNGYPSGTHFIFGGDFNMYTSSEAGYQDLVGSQPDNDGRCFDPVDKPGYWHDSYTFRREHTQSPRVTSSGGFTGGGVDDRYDQLLVSAVFEDGDGLSYVIGSHKAFGNDGYRLNNNINNPVNQEISQEMADALYYASDHIPLLLEIQVPAKVDVAASLAFGKAVVASTAEELLTVANSATVPADELDYSLAAPGGFTAPGGSFQLSAGSGNDHTISMDTASVGAKAGDLTVNSNDLDDPAIDVALSGTVVDHASPSLDAASVVLADTLDFGSHEIGTFSDMVLSVHNDGYGSLQALLEIYDAAIVGGDGRFSFVGGFTEESVGADAAEYTLHFDDAGATPSTLYAATLTLSNRDESGIHGGGGALSDLTVYLEAFVEDGTGVPDDGVLRLALSSGVPNPFTERTSLVFSLPSSSSVRIEIFDIAGRLVRTLESGVLPAGEHEVVWTGRDDRGRQAASGIYFCRATVGDWREVRKVVLLR
jgi:endonuclease/exonuclease/phosphatase family metal-dependent hydrolase